MVLAVLAGEHKHVVVGDLLLAVGEFQEVFVDLVEGFAVELHAEHLQTMLEGGVSGAGGQHD